MSLIRKNRGLQYPLFAEFTFNLTDTMVATDGVTRVFGGAAGTVFDVIPLPPNAVVIGGDVTVEVATTDAGSAISLGDSISPTRYLGVTSLGTVGRTALTLTGLRGAGEDIRMTLANSNGTATAGTVTVRVGYIVSGRTNETQIS